MTFILNENPISIEEEKDSENPKYIWVSLNDLTSSTDFSNIPASTHLDLFFDENASLSKINLSKSFQGSIKPLEQIVKHDNKKEEKKEKKQTKNKKKNKNK